MSLVLTWLFACAPKGEDTAAHLDWDGDGATAADDCDDRDARRTPGAEEVCDRLDNDCDDLVDEEDSDLLDGSSWFRDADGDGAGDGSASTTLCSRADGYVGSAGDCDDEDPTVSTSSTWYEDADGDGYGDPESTSTACGAPVDHVADGTDCDDAAADVHPDAAEVCGDGLDQDCDGTSNGCGPGGTLPGDAWVIEGADAQDGFGGTVVRIDDALAVSAPGARTNRGQISLWTYDDDFSEEIALAGDDPGDGIGDLYAVGDTDGDGTTDLVVASTTVGTGSVWLFRGPFTEGLDMADAPAIFTGDVGGFAAGVTGVGDQDGDGRDDLLVGVVRSGSSAPAAYVFSGASGGSLTPADAIATVRAPTVSGISGADVLRAGDTDGDGVEELAVLDEIGTVRASSEGVVYLIDMELSTDVSLADAEARVHSGEASAGSGMVAVAPGDVDGDGYADLFIGFELKDAGATDAGRAAVLLGPFSGDTAVTAAAGSVSGVRGTEHVGGTLGAADVDGDGLPDLLTSGADPEAVSMNRGEVLVLYAPVTGDWTSDAIDAQLTGAASAQQAGAALGGVGDLDGDGDDEIYVGAPGPTDSDDPGHVYVIPGGEGM